MSTSGLDASDGLADVAIEAENYHKEIHDATVVRRSVCSGKLFFHLIGVVEVCRSMTIHTRTKQVNHSLTK